MMGKPTTNWTRHKHAFLQRVAKGPCYAAGVAEGTACTHLRALFWVRQVDSRIGIKVEITDEGRRALALWDAGERMPIDVRSEEQRIRDVVQDLVDKAVAAGVVEQLARALRGQALPSVEGLATSLARQSIYRAGGALHSGGIVQPREGEAPAILESAAEYWPHDHPMVQALQRQNLTASLGTVCRSVQL